jgi:putative phosphoesterase
LNLMKLCIVSDSHDDGASLARCVAAAKAEGAAAVLHCGDIIGTNTLRAALAVGLPLHAIHGNNLGDPASLSRMMMKSDGALTYHGQDATLTRHGRRIFVVHYPHYGQAMALTGDYDLVCCGHSHEAHVGEVANVKGGSTWLVNPGTTAGLGAPSATWILGDLETMQFEIRAVPAA